MRFLLKAGKHRMGQKGLNLKRHGVDRPDTIHVYNALEPKNCIIEDSAIDLVKRFGREKFERLPDEPKANGKAKAK